MIFLESSSGSSSNSEQKNNGVYKAENSENNTQSKASKLGIVREETVLGSIKIIKNNTPSKDATASTNQMSKWPGSRIQRNVKLMPKRNDISNNSSNNLLRNESNLLNNLSDFNPETSDPSPSKAQPEKRKNESVDETSAKKPRPEVIRSYNFYKFFSLNHFSFFNIF